MRHQHQTREHRREHDERKYEHSADVKQAPLRLQGARAASPTGIGPAGLGRRSAPQFPGGTRTPSGKPGKGRRGPARPRRRRRRRSSSGGRPSRDRSHRRDLQPAARDRRAVKGDVDADARAVADRQGVEGGEAVAAQEDVPADLRAHRLVIRGSDRGVPSR